MISILDTTYREGKQSYLGNILPKSILGYVHMLDKIGIEYVEIAYPFVSKVYLEQFRLLVKSKTNIKISVHSALNTENFDKLINEGIRNINVSLKVRDLNREIINEQITSIKNILEHCRERNIIVPILRVGIEYAFKLPFNFLISLCNKIAAMNEVTKISLSDTDGSTVPDKIRKLLIQLDRKLPSDKSLELHLHNDYALATTNLHEAYRLFKNSKRELIIDASISGIGERNGIVSIGDIFALLLLNNDKKIKTKYKTQYYCDLYKYVFKNEIYNRDPLNSYSFSHSSGLHISKFLESGIYQKIKPEIFGQKTKLMFTELVSSDAIRIFTSKKLKIELDKDTASKIAVKMRNILAKNQLTLNEIEAASMIKEILKEFF